MGKSKVDRETIDHYIQSNIREHKRDVVRMTQEKYQLSRPTVMKYVNELIDEKKIEVKGRTKDREYSPLALREKLQQYEIKKGLEENSIWKDFSPLVEDVPQNVRIICQYGFTEMVNNAIEHSEGRYITIDMTLFYDQVEMWVVDDGVGIFNKIQKLYGLSDPIHSILELSKGKLTSDTEKHSGEGIFFTSRIFDYFFMKSEKIGFVHTKSGFDYIDQGDEFTKGTAIEMEIQLTSRRSLQDVFDAFTDKDGDFGFDKTVVPVHLAVYGDDQLISRSQARRLLTRFEKFKHVVLEFKGVQMIGQSFADEIFRVFTNEHPEVRITYVDANKTVEKMIRHADVEDRNQ